MPAGARHVVRYTQAAAGAGSILSIRGWGVGEYHSVPMILGRESRLPRKTELALLLCAVLFMSPAADLMFARDGAAQTGSATTANEAAGRGKAGLGRGPAATAEATALGLPQKAVEIARPWGFPNTLKVEARRKAA